MTFEDIKASAEQIIPVLNIAIRATEEELLRLQREKEEQEGMLSDATKWIESSY